MAVETHSRFYQFGEFRIDVASRKLLRNEAPVNLTPKAFETLLLLVQNSGRVLTKPELVEALWPESFVEENNLAQNISAVRKALGDAGVGKRWILTVPGRGYRFDAEVLASRDVPGGFSVTRFSRWVRGLAGLLIIASIAAMLWIVTKHQPASTGGGLTVTRLTYSGNASRTAISRDGRLLAIVTGDVGNQALTVRELATGKDIELAGTRRATYMGLTFTPAGTELYVVLRENAALVSGLYVIRLSDGQWVKALDNIDSPVTFSPDGARFAFIREDAKGGQSILIVSNGAGHESRVASRNAPDLLDYPAWSPDGRTIVCTLVDRKNNVTGLLAVPVTSQNAFEVGPRRWRNAMRLSWAGAQLMIIARQPGAESMGIWTVSYPDGVSRRLTNDLEHYYWMGTTADGLTIAASQRRTLTSIWAAPVGDSGDAEQIAAGGLKYSGLTSTSAGKILFARGAGNVTDIWSMNADGSGQVQLTRSTNAYLPTPCGPDERIAYVAEKDSTFESWLMDADGSQARRIFRHRGNTGQDCSHDGKWIVHTAAEGGWQRLWRTATHDAASQKLGEAWVRNPAVSPDNKRIAVFYAERPESTQEAPNAIAVVPFDGGSPEFVFPIDDSVNQLAALRWTPEGTGISYVRNERGVGNVWVQPLSGGPPRRVTNLKGDRIFYFCWSRDGETVFVVRGTMTHDVVLMKRTQ